MWPEVSLNDQWSTVLSLSHADPPLFHCFKFSMHSYCFYHFDFSNDFICLCFVAPRKSTQAFININCIKVKSPALECEFIIVCDWRQMFVRPYHARFHLGLHSADRSRRMSPSGSKDPGCCSPQRRSDRSPGDQDLRKHKGVVNTMVLTHIQGHFKYTVICFILFDRDDTEKRR